MARGTKTVRPVYLSLTRFSFPLPAIGSITHRFTGVVLFFGVGFLLYLLDESLASPQGLENARTLLAAPIAKIALLVVLATLAYHLVAGIKHLLLDFDIGDSLEGARLSTQITFAASAVLIVLAGAWLW